MQNAPTAAAIQAIRAWLRLEQSFDGLNTHLRTTHGITGAQLAMLRIVAERPQPVPMQSLRGQLAMHPATLGQLIDRIVQRGWLTRRRARRDSRRLDLTVTAGGRRLLDDAPLAGPVRLRSQAADGARLRRLARAFDDAVILFGLEEWAP
jgi:DNA-binding MarR family transcriptional regulator